MKSRIATAFRTRGGAVNESWTVGENGVGAGSIGRTCLVSCEVTEEGIFVPAGLVKVGGKDRGEHRG
jgi:hypothetical protein